MTSSLKKIVKHWDTIAVLLFCIIYTIIFSKFSILRHEAFFSNYDLCNMSQTIWNTLHGHLFSLSDNGQTVSRFSIHFDPILILISPLYLIWNNVKILLIFQSLALGTGGLAVFLISKKIIGKNKNIKPLYLKIFSITAVTAYLLNPYMQWSNIYDFHAVVLFVPLFLFAFYFLLSKKWFRFWILISLCLITKEEIGFIIAILGIYIFLFFRKKLGLLTLFTGIFVSLFAIFWVIPHFSPMGAHWAVNGLYAPAKQKLGEAKNIPMLIDLFKGYFLSPKATNYYTGLLKPFSFLPVLGLPFLIFTVPELAVNLLSTDSQMQNLNLHYTSGITPFIVLATIFGVCYLISFICRFKQFRKTCNFVLLFISFVMVFSAIRSNYHNSPLPTTPTCWCEVYQVNSEDVQIEKVLMNIPKNASVTSSGEIRPHISLRANSFTLPGGLSADYVALFTNNRILYDRSPKGFENSLLQDKKFLGSHALLNRIGDFYLFRKIQ